MNITFPSLIPYLLFGFILCCGATAIASDDVSDIAAVRYEGQSKFSCNKIEFQIPTYLPYMRKWSSNDHDLHLTAPARECSSETLHMIIGKTPDCLGQNFCTEASFYFSKIGESPREHVSSYLLAYAQDIKLHKNITGYFVPSRCFSYCNEAKLVWFSDGILFEIGTHSNNSNETKDELVKSANSYIDIERK